MTGVHAKRAKRGAIKIWILGDNQNKARVNDLSLVAPVERKLGLWLGKFYTNDACAATADLAGLFWFACYSGRLIESNHPHWRGRAGYAFGEKHIP